MVATHESFSIISTLLRRGYYAGRQPKRESLKIRLKQTSVVLETKMLFVAALALGQKPTFANDRYQVASPWALNRLGAIHFRACLRPHV